jgi:tripartite-type tricarboxylate transporter receptor subunit TctC
MKLARITPLTFAVIVCLAAAPAGAQPGVYPVKPLRLVTGSAPGGGSDFVARILADRLRERLGQPALVDNRAGGAGSIGTDIVAKANPDGHTMLISTVSALAVNPSLQKLPYDVQRDLQPVSQISQVAFALAVNPSVPAKTVTELIQLAKSQPGKLSYASSGIGSAAHLSMELFKNMAGVDIVHVPYKGSSPAALDLIGGRVQAAFNNLIPTLPHIRSGKLRALGVSGLKRTSVLAEVPTVAESGLPGFDSQQSYGLVLPARTPKNLLAFLHGELMSILREPVVRTRLTEEGGEIVASTPAEFTAYIKTETAKWSKVVKAANIRAE